jgi:hypothetical protein
MAGKKQFFQSSTIANPLLRRTDEEDAKTRPQEESTPAAPEKPATKQSTVFLSDEQIEWLESRHLEIRRGGGSATIKKAAILRALLQVAMDCDINLKGAKTERELVTRIKTGMGIG